jgi:DNA polymerase-3 subunit gamma/tau
MARADEPPPWVDAPFDDEVAAAPARAAAPLPSPPPRAESTPVQSFPAGGIGQRWHELVREMIDASRIQAMTRELAVQSQCTVFDERAEPLRCGLRVEREMLRAPAHVEKLQAALAETLGRAVRLEVEAGVAEDSPVKRDAAERARRQAEAEQIIHDDPLVQALMAQYKNARIVPGSVKPH